MRVLLFTLWLLASVALAGAGFWNLTEATKGVGLIALALLFAVFARIAQAGHFDERLRELIKPQDKPE